jgi:Peptidase A4 family
MTLEARLICRAIAGTACAFGAVGVLAAGTAGAAAGGLNLPAPAPATHAASPFGTEKNGSYNWSGYVQTAGVGAAKFFAVRDTWIVPTVNTTPVGNQYSADWVGIGGFSDSTLVQAGTEADNIGGTPVYRAWTEILPEPENPLTLVVNPGDKITTTVREAKAGKWTMTVMDVTTKLKGSRTVAYAGSAHLSVESIHERPCIIAPCNTTADLAELTQTNPVTFDPGKYATAVGLAPSTGLLTLATGATLHQIFMVNNLDTAIIASPSPPDKDNDGFTVADGNVEPPAPQS